MKKLVVLLATFLLAGSALAATSPRDANGTPITCPRVQKALPLPPLAENDAGTAPRSNTRAAPVSPRPQSTTAKGGSAPRWNNLLPGMYR